MSFLRVLTRLLGWTSGAGGDANAFYLYVRCRHCSEKLRVRVDRRYDLQQEFDEGADRVSGYSLNKDVLGQECFRLMRVNVQYDAAHRELSRTVEGGEFIAREEYEADEGARD